MGVRVPATNHLFNTLNHPINISENGIIREPQQRDTICRHRLRLQFITRPHFGRSMDVPIYFDR